MQFTTAIFTTLALALSARADSLFCFPIPGQPATVPQDILDLDVQTKLNWAATLCSQLVFPSPTDEGNGIQTNITSLADGILGSDGKLYGLEVVSIFLAIFDLKQAFEKVQYANVLPDKRLSTTSKPRTTAT
jgi:hypothetical protein